MAKRHIRVRLPEDILAGMDRALAKRPNWSRDDIVTDAVALWLRAQEDGAIDASIIAGYTRLPPDEDEAEFGRISDRAQGFLDEW